MSLKKDTPRLLFACAVFSLAIPAVPQRPVIFDVSDVTVGANKIQTGYLYAAGKWSDAGDRIGPLSTEIQCYKNLGFCAVANAFTTGDDANVSLDSFDILRWDSQEMIAVDSSAICIVSTLRADFATKRITLSSSDKGVTKDPLCKGSDKIPTAVLWGEKDIVKDAIGKAKSKRHEPAAKPN
ncbi:MAG: hypothetical protein WAL75_19555 [Terracidiphilus sp.]